MTETQIKIIEAAEIEFANHGFEGASVRDITSRAEVNIAAINYHFGSKADLFIEMIRYRIEPINQLRIELLEEALQKSRGNPLPLRQVLEIIIRPLIKNLTELNKGEFHFMRAMGRGLTEESRFMANLHDILADVISRFRAVLANTLSNLSSEEIAYCFHFMSCSIGGVMMQHQKLESISGGMIDLTNTNALINRLITFIEGGIASLQRERATSSET